MSKASTDLAHPATVQPDAGPNWFAVQASPLDGICCPDRATPQHRIACCRVSFQQQSHLSCSSLTLRTSIPQRHRGDGCLHLVTDLLNLVLHSFCILQGGLFHLGIQVLPVRESVRQVSHRGRPMSSLYKCCKVRHGGLTGQNRACPRLLGELSGSLLAQPQQSKTCFSGSLAHLAIAQRPSQASYRRPHHGSGSS